jgi:GDP-4-dehydro-6-deoxy-D-mannose reductase
VTGAAGFAGSHLLDLLAADSVPFAAWYRPGGTPPRLRPGIEWRPVDLLDRETVRAELRRSPPDAVYHLAGATHVGRSWVRVEATLAANVRATHHLLDALRVARRSIPVLIPSSAVIYKSADSPLCEDAPVAPASPYAVSKLAQELLGVHAIDDGIEVYIARPFNHIGPRQDPSFAASDFARQIAEIEVGRRPPEIVVGNLEARREATDVRDTVRAYRLVLEHGQPGRPYNVSSGVACSIREVLDRLVARARVPVAVRIDPARLRPNDVPLLVGDSARIRTELGWTPAIPLERTLDDVLEYWRDQIQ